jgi:hypothetical protein
VASHGYSGSTLLSFLVGLHPEVVSVGEFTGPDVGGDRGAYVCSCNRCLRECPFWNRIAQRANRDETIFRVESFDTAFYLSSNRLLRRLRTGSLRSSTAERLRDRLFFGLWPGHARAIGRLLEQNTSVARAILEVSGKSIFVDASKDPIRMRFLRESDALDLYVVHLVRDVRGVVTSTLSRCATATAASAARSWIWCEHNITRHLQSIPPDRRMLLRYEDLCRDPLSSLNELFAFLGARPLEHLREFRSQEHHVIGNRMRRRSASEIKLDEKWKKSLSADQLRVIRDLAGPVATSYGYDL